MTRSNCRRWCGLVLVAIASAPALASDPFNLEGLRAIIAEHQGNLDARANDPVLGHVDNAAGLSLPVYGVGLPDIVGAPGQPVRKLLEDRGEPLRERTRQTGWELCARVCVSKEGRYGIRPATIRSALACATSPSICPVGFLPTHQSVHTHGAGPIVSPTPVDLVLDPGAIPTHVSPNALSSQDRSVPGTWLLAPNGTVVN